MFLEKQRQAFSTVASGGGYLDLAAACPCDNVGHQVDSLIYWNGPEGISPDRTIPLTGLGPHFFTTHDAGNTYTRETL